MGRGPHKLLISPYDEEMNVWIVDDDQSLRWVLEKALKQANFTPRSFERAEHMLEAMSHSQPDVLITDVRMPGVSGELKARLPPTSGGRANLPGVVPAAALGGSG